MVTVEIGVVPNHVTTGKCGGQAERCVPFGSTSPQVSLGVVIENLRQMWCFAKYDNFFTFFHNPDLGKWSTEMNMSWASSAHKVRPNEGCRCLARSTFLLPSVNPIPVSARKRTES